jgi:iron complex transport system substrate-binding protein
VQTGRGPATVIGKLAESQVTLPSCSGRVSFARENTVRNCPSLVWGFFIGCFSRNSRQGRFVPDSTFRCLPRALVFFASLLFLCAMDMAAQATSPDSPPPPAMREVVDGYGRTVRLPLNPSRIISLAPSLTETVYALGVQDRLVGDTDYCDYPPEAQKKPKVGGVTNPNLEQIAALHPDLVLVTKEGNLLETVRALDTIGIPSYATDARTVEEIISSTQKLADVLNASASGKALTDDLQRRLSVLRSKLSAVPPRKVLFVVWTEPLISVGKDTFIADALRRAGAASIVDSSHDWPQVSLEEVAHLQPEFLVFAASHSDTSARELDALANRPGWRILDAVHNRNIAVISDAIIRPAPRIVSVIEDLARQLHPEVFADAPGTENATPPTNSPAPANPTPKPIALRSAVTTCSPESPCAL